ncbi:hypothetical protein B0A52_10368 [Exophiala mesophila]|uniref:Uncharacterized protein n=1 Tax=Exophiala mesophila TaxID=212818 RepID=A0A438MQA7_EXOME|nr:hypothetical protein B0A52_10368 [Exophiala mesophila]
MSFKNVMKDGWHPKGKDGGKESWRGDFKGINQVAGWMGKPRDPKAAETEAHVSRPLATLKDPSSFGPPPKNVNYHGGAALPNEITPHRSGWGAPLTPEQTRSARAQVNGSQPQTQEEEAPERPAGPPLPYRADRTGLKTDHLPPPPTHRDVNRSPGPSTSSPAPSNAPRPGLPPRLPNRQNTGSSVVSNPVVSPPPATAPPAYETVAQSSEPQPGNHFGSDNGAIQRLGNAGISVPGLGINSQSSMNPWQNEQSKGSIPKTPSPKPQPSATANQVSELQSRFARMTSASSVPTQSNVATPATQSPPPVQSQPNFQDQSQPQGSTWAEKQAALRTASNLQKDPSSVTMADARSAATTANSFRERHKDEISSASQRANSFNKKYNVTGKLNAFLEKHASPTNEQPPQLNQQQQSPQSQNDYYPPQATQAVNPRQMPEYAASISRKPPPPPPPKKPANMHGNANPGHSNGVTSPPPLPLSTKPGAKPGSTGTPMQPMYPTGPMGEGGGTGG